MDGTKDRAPVTMQYRQVMAEESSSEKLIKIGSPVIGAMAASALTLATGGTGGILASAIGPLVSHFLETTAGDFLERALSKGEQEKVSEGFIKALSEISRRLEDGDELRRDGFFDQSENGSSPAAEIFEGVLLKCKSEHERKKTLLLGNIFGNAAFEQEVPTDLVNAVISLCERMTYRQICLLALVGHMKTWGLDTTMLREDENLCRSKWYGKLDEAQAEFLLSDLYEIGSESLRLINYAPQDMQRSLFESRSNEVSGPVNLTHLGQACFKLMGLQEIEGGDLTELLCLFQTQRLIGPEEGVPAFVMEAIGASRSSNKTPHE